MISLKGLGGLPVVVNGRQWGTVDQGILEKNGEWLAGIAVRSPKSGVKWIKQADIIEIGGVCVSACGHAEKKPKDKLFALGLAYDTSGLCLGQVEDALLEPNSYRVCALVISPGPLERLKKGVMLSPTFSVLEDRQYHPDGSCNMLVADCMDEKTFWETEGRRSES